ncbi:hypothetical protein [Duganella rhizosphaerae]|uniref:hypothetical protein n=1 Tax=Duganella rhizosphaerae TaxID=2885763 RepID=UPI00403F6C87
MNNDASKAVQVATIAKAQQKKSRRSKKPRGRDKYPPYSEFSDAVIHALDKAVKTSLGHRVEGEIHIGLEIGFHEKAPGEIIAFALTQVVCTPNVEVMRCFGVPAAAAKNIQRVHVTEEFTYMLDSYDLKYVDVIAADLAQEVLMMHDVLEDDARKCFRASNPTAAMPDF